MRKKPRQIAALTRLTNAWPDENERPRLLDAVHALDINYDLSRKIAHERRVAEVVTEMIDRLGRAFARLSALEGLTILDVPCGSNTSRAPAPISPRTLLGKIGLGRRKGYAPQFEPWFCRILLELGADPVGVDFGDLDGESFRHYHADLGQTGALDFLPSSSFDAIQDSRLFGSPEFTAQFPKRSDRLAIARELVEQERRLLKAGGIMIHSDAAALLAKSAPS